jgi:hypothetical protein
MPDTTDLTQTPDTTTAEVEPSTTTEQTMQPADQMTDGIAEKTNPGLSQTDETANESATTFMSASSDQSVDSSGPAADAEPSTSPSSAEEAPSTTTTEDGTGAIATPSMISDDSTNTSKDSQPSPLATGGSSTPGIGTDGEQAMPQPASGETQTPSIDAVPQDAAEPSLSSETKTEDAAAPSSDTSPAFSSDPTPAQTDPAALAAPGEITGGTDASAQGDVAQGPTDTPDSGAATDTGINTDTGIDTDTSIDTDTDTDTGINTDTGISPDQSSEAPVAKTPDHGSDGEGGDQEAESFGTVADSVGSEIAQSLQQDGPSGDDSAQDTSQQEDQGDDDSSKGGVPAEDAVVPPMFDGDAGEGPTHAGTDTPPMLISKPCDPVTGKPLDGSMQPVGVIVGGSGSLNKVSVPADSGDGGWQDAEADDGSSSSDACDDDNECCGLQDQLLQVRSAVEDLVSQVQDTAQQILQLLQ